MASPVLRIADATSATRLITSASGLSKLQHRIYVYIKCIRILIGLSSVPQASFARDIRRHHYAFWMREDACVEYDICRRNGEEIPTLLATAMSAQACRKSR